MAAKVIAGAVAISMATKTPSGVTLMGLQVTAVRFRSSVAGIKKVLEVPERMAE